MTVREPIGPVRSQESNRISETIQGERKSLEALCSFIHSNPELCYEEHKSHDTIVDFLKTRKLDVVPHAHGLQTSFVAEQGSGGRLVTICAEYDALPGIGHACGHNLIATAAVAAFLGIVAALESSGISGRVRLLGCPAEEGGGGKIKLLDAGAFTDVDAALMVHPSPPDRSGALKGPLAGIAYGTSTAAVRFRVVFAGKPAHAGAMPWLGINALDAAALSYSAVGMLRQQLRPTDRVNLIITEGGTQNNIITATSTVSVAVRTSTFAENTILTSRVRKCFEGAALATGCELEFIDEGAAYADLRPNMALCEDFSSNMANDFDSKFYCNFDQIIFGGYGTDMGNVSYACPSIHPTFYIPVQDGENIHGPGFARASGAAEAMDATLQAATGIALTAWRVLDDEAFAQRARNDFEADKANR